MLRIVALAVVLLLAAPAGARAQEPTRADSADVLVGTAERLHARGSRDLAAALARLVESRYGETPAAARAARLLDALRTDAVSRSGRVGLIAFSTIYGAWLGVAVPLALDARSPEAYGLGLLTGAPLGFLAGRAYTQGRSITGGDAGVVTWAGTWATWQGAGWMLVLGDGFECQDDLCFEDGPDGNETVGAMVGAGLLGLVAGGVAADRWDIDGGTATMVGWGSLWGSWAGIVTSVVLDLEDEDALLTTTLIGGDLGLLAGAVLAPDWHMSTGRAWLINAAGIMGGAIGGGFDLLLQPDDERVAILIPAVGSAIGLAAGAYLTRDADEGTLREGMLHDPADRGALVRLSAGRWRLAPPLVAPTLLRGERADSRGERADSRGGRAHPRGAPADTRAVELGIRVPLLDARF